MPESDKNQGFDAFCGVAEQFATCMNDYLFVYDIMNDYKVVNNVILNLTVLM